MKNREVADIFERIADLLELKGENLFRIRAYRKAAQNVEALAEDIEETARKGELEDIPGIGKDLAGKIEEIIATGALEYYQELKKEFPEGLFDILSIPGLGPHTTKILFEERKIRTLEGLEALARAGKLQGLPGIQKKTEENILKGIALVRMRRQRMPLGVALSLSEEIIGRLEKVPEVKKIAACGSLRRMKETVRDIDILVVSKKPEKVMDEFVGLPIVGKINAHGMTKSSIVTKEGIQADLRVVERGDFGAALQYFTGSKAHNIRVRELAKRNGKKINEYGVFDVKNGKKIAGREEDEVYRALGLSYIPPELREDRGEVEACLEGKLPKLVELSDIKGDLHVHTNASDGVHTIEDLVEYARGLGYAYIGITDHSRSLRIAGGLKEKELRKQMDEIHSLNKKLKGFRVFAGNEVDIGSDGKLDYPDSVLAEMDVVIAAIHSGFKQSKEKLTARIISACENKYVNIIAHPTSRLIGERDPYEIDLEKIFDACRKSNTAIEVNSYYQRLDLNDTGCRLAKEMGVKVVINTDAHVIEQLGMMRLGVSVARRGWLEKSDVLNTLPAEKLLSVLKK